MPFSHHNLKPSFGSRTKTRRVGRGNASSRGTYSGKGQKGQRARTGGRRGLTQFGLRMMLQGIPKRKGFKSLYIKPAVINVGDLDIFDNGAVVNPKTLVEKNLIKDTKKGVKILGSGELKNNLTVSGCYVSQSAREKIEKAGGKIELRSY